MSSLSFGFVVTLLSISLNTIFASEDVPCSAYHTDFYSIEFDHTTTETYETTDGTQSYEIGWKKMMFCLEGHNDDASAIQYTGDGGTSTYMELISKYAITVKVAPDDATDPNYDEKAVYSKICHNPIVALNNNREMSYTIDVNTITTSGPLDADDWFDHSDGNAVSNLDTTCEEPLAPLTTDVIHSCQQHNGLHIQTNDQSNQRPVCEWNLNKGKHRHDGFISIYFGFDANRKYVCGGQGTEDLIPIASLPKTRRRRTQRRRRLQTTTNYYDPNTGDLYNAPCLRLQVDLQTENVVPTNNDPDPQTNIMLVGMGLAGDTTNGVLTWPDIADPLLSEDPVFTDENTWDVQCIDTTEVEEEYVPRGDPLDFDDAQVISIVGGFEITLDFETPESIIYSFDMESLDLTMSHSCDADISLSGQVEDAINGDVVGSTTIVSVPSNAAATHYSLPFEWMMVLYPNVSYVAVPDRLRLLPSLSFTIVITGIYGEELCDLTQVTIGNNPLRRRMALSLSELTATSNANACEYLRNLAQSDALKTAQIAMCRADWASLSPVVAGLWRMKNQQTAIGNYLVRPGSMRVFDTAGSEVLKRTDWPKTEGGALIKKPCIAVDESTQRVFAVGGFIKGTTAPTDTIAVYQLDFSGEQIDGHVVTELNGWTLDKPRYGCMCLYWRKDASSEYLVVISGVTDDINDEFDASKPFLNDIRLFPVPTSEVELNDVWGGTYSKPDSGTKWLKNKNVLDSRTLIYGGHFLYLWGGKTASSSTNLVSRVDLLDIESSGSVTAATAEVMQLSKEKAMPMIDKVPVDVGGGVIQQCYAVFMGQSYEADAAGKAVWQDVDADGDAGLNPDNLQLFCNGNVDPEVDTNRRRLSARFTEYDRAMMAPERRRLAMEEDETSEVFFRKYNYALDGIWYDMSVEVEVCYDTNAELENAVTFYNGIILDNGQVRTDYLTEIGAKMLDKSEETYRGWSSGFGAVDVADLGLNNVNALRCRPVLQIWVNQGCTAHNIEYWDTNVRWSDALAVYTNVYDVVSDISLLSDAPLDELSQMVLNHSCVSDNDFAAFPFNVDDDIDDGSYPWYYVVIAIMSVYNLSMSYSLWCSNSDAEDQKYNNKIKYDNII
eukprot:80345_1